MLGFDDSLKSLKREWKDAGVDMNVVRDWQKQYDKVKKQAVVLESQYVQIKSELEKIYELLLVLEQMLVSTKVRENGATSFAVKSKVLEIAKEMKKYQEHFNHEFLISKEDSEFHLTYSTLLSLCNGPMNESQQILILQSEVENLLALAKEALEKEWPSFYEMAFYYLGRSDKEIFDIPHSDKVAKVKRVYENEFMKPIREVLLARLSQERVQKILEEEIWN